MSDTPQIGEVVGTYRLERELGTGSTSRVFLGTHVRLGRKAAVKVLSGAVVGDARAISRLLTEAQVVNDIRHPNIVDISDFIETDDPRRVALVMEYIEGPSLKVLRGDPLPVSSAMGVALQLVAAVDAAHKAGVVHRDIKPDNLLLCADPKKSLAVPKLKIVDFGIAKNAGDAMGSKPATGIMIGTPAYMAPEQIAGTPPPSAATDVYAIGEVLYELLTGERAFAKSSAAEIVQYKLRGGPPVLKALDCPGGDELLALIRNCLQSRQHQRPSLDEVRNVLITHTPKSIRRQLGADVVDERDLIETLPTDDEATQDSDAMLETLQATDPPAGIAPVPTGATQLVAFAETAVSALGDVSQAEGRTGPTTPIAFADTVASPTRPISADAVSAAVSAEAVAMASSVQPRSVTPAEAEDPETLPDTAPGTPPAAWPEDAARTKAMFSDPASRDERLMGTLGPQTVAPSVFDVRAQRSSWRLAAVAAALSAGVLGATAIVLSKDEPVQAKSPTKEAAPLIVPSAVVEPLVARVTSTPAGAEVKMRSGALLGRTPIDVPVKSGETIEVQVQAPGHRPERVVLNEAGKQIHVDLSRLPPPKPISKKPKTGRSAPIDKDEFPTW